MTNEKRCIIITESQKDFLLEQMLFESSIFEVESIEELKQILRRAILKGVIISATTIATICTYFHLSKEQKQDIETFIENVSNTINNPVQQETWRLAADDVLATVYNAKPSQCNNDVRHTASMFNLNLNNVLSHRIIAMERTFMAELGLKFGDVVRIEGADEYDGEWQIQDVMNKRFAGQHKIDILVPNNITRGKWENVKLYVLNDKSQTNDFKSNFAGQFKNTEK